LTSVPNPAGDQDPASVALPGELPKPVNSHFWLQSVAELGSTALIANSAPPSSAPDKPFSPN
jgi:hypothetical protein